MSTDDIWDCEDSSGGKGSSETGMEGDCGEEVGDVDKEWRVEMGIWEESA